MASTVLLRKGLEPFPGYQLRRLIGRGGFAEVWAAHTAEGRQVALKFLSCTSGRATPQEIRALQIIRELRHPNLVEIHRIWCHLGYIIVAMELADGSLKDMLDVCQHDFRTVLAPELACDFLRQAAVALDFLNSPHLLDGGRRGSIQHGDIKPSNILVVGDTVKLADFGLASLKTAGAGRHSPGGTLAYAAPEVYEGRVSERTDQFALAVTYCELRGGRLPFPRLPAGFQRGFSHPPPDLTMLAPKEVTIIARALSPLSTDRWPSCVEMMDRLSRVAR